MSSYLGHKLAAIGSQSLTLTLVNGAFMEHLADCRTFCHCCDDFC